MRRPVTRIQPNAAAVLPSAASVHSNAASVHSNAAALLLSLAAALGAGGARADNAAFQGYFFRVCDAAVAELANRCAETPGGQGDLSGNSESSLNPGQTLSGTDAAFSSARARSEEARDRMARYRSEATAAEGPQLTLGPLSLLVNGRAEWERFDRDPQDNERSYDADRLALEVGADRRFGEHFVLGLLYSYEAGDLTFAGEAPGVGFVPVASAGGQDRRAHSVTVFTLVEWLSGGYLEASAGYVWSDYDITRRAVFQESTRTVPQTNVVARGDTDGREYWGSLTGGYDWTHGATSVGVYAGIDYAEGRIDGYRERDGGGTGLAMRVERQERDDVVGHAGVRWQRAFGTDAGVWVPQLRLAYHDLITDSTSRSAVRFDEDAAGLELILEGEERDGYVSIGAGLAGIFPGGWTAFVDLEGLAAAGDREQYRATVGVRKEL